MPIKCREDSERPYSVVERALVRRALAHSMGNPAEHAVAHVVMTTLGQEANQPNSVARASYPNESRAGE